MMYEGKNIHHANSDNKLLCSFSNKLCNQRRLNGYGFCVRHILEDPTAPFKRCIYVAKSSHQMCTQAIPKNEDRRYCNNHMQVLGMLPKKERKRKEQKVVPGSIEAKPIVIGMSPNPKAKFSLSIKEGSGMSFTPPRSTPPSSTQDHEDPYAFSDGFQGKCNDYNMNDTIMCSDSILGKSLQSGQGFVRSACDIGTTGALSLSGGSTIAKYYPELAEKLEKMRNQPETPKSKSSSKSKARTSRTMNKLQTKIAQNKINEKLRKSQEVNHTDSNSSPIEISSPEQSIFVDASQSPKSHFNPLSHTFSSQAPTAIQFSSGRKLTGYEQKNKVAEVPPLPLIDTSILTALAAQDNMGFQNATASEMALSSSRLMSPHTPPRLPPPYPGSSTLSTPVSLTSSDLPPGAFSPQGNINIVLDNLTVGMSESPQGRKKMSFSNASMLNSLQFTPPRQTSSLGMSAQTFMSPASTISFTSSQTSNFSCLTTTSNRQSIQPVPGIQSFPNQKPASSNMDIFSLLNIQQSKHLGMNSIPGLSQAHILAPPVAMAAHVSLPPPPPYVAPVTTPKVAATVSSVVPKHSLSKSTSPKAVVAPTAALSPVARSAVPHQKLHKLNGLLTEKAAKHKLKSDPAVKLYSYYAKRKISNHCMVGPYLCSSDDDSEDEDFGMLPWQQDVFSASSDEEREEEEDTEDEVPMEMRPTKLSLLKTRMRRQWCQARKASRSNKALRQSNNQATLALIRCVRDSGASAVRALWQIHHVHKSKKRLLKLKKKHRQCCQKSKKDGQCKNQCLPYTNHCLRHVKNNVDQQLFDYCTAKFADNTQCCMPVFDIRHELPLCPVHAAKADNYQRQLEAENSKRPRKKTKPPALTRPPRKGKKKKKGNAARHAAIPVVSVEPGDMDSGNISDVDVTGLDSSRPEDELRAEIAGLSRAASEVKDAEETEVKVKAKQILGLELDDMELDKQFDLHDQASGLLEEADFRAIGKMPFDALDLFGKNGDPEPEMDVEPLIGGDASHVTKAALEKLMCGVMSEEESMQLAMVLAQNLGSDSDAGQLMNMDLSSLVSEVESTSCFTSDSDATSSRSMQQQAGLLQPHSGNLNLNATATQHIRTKVTSATSSHIPMFDQQLNIQSTCSSSGLSLAPPTLTTDLDSVYSHIQNLSQSQLVNDVTSGVLNLNHLSSQLGFDSSGNMSTSKTLVRQLSTPQSGNMTLPAYQSGIKQDNNKSAVSWSASMPVVNVLPVSTSAHGQYSLTQSSSSPILSLANASSSPTPAKANRQINSHKPPMSLHKQPTSKQQQLKFLQQQKLLTLQQQKVTTQPNNVSVVMSLTDSPASLRLQNSTLPSLSKHSSFPVSQPSRLTLGSQPGQPNHQPSNLPTTNSPGLKLLSSSRPSLGVGSQLSLAKHPPSRSLPSQINTTSSLSFSSFSPQCLTSRPPQCLTSRPPQCLTSRPSARHNLLSDSLGPNNNMSELISVTVRQPSSLESVPTTVRHTLPDTFPSQESLPSSPSLLPPPMASSRSSSPLVKPTQALVSSSNHIQLQSSEALSRSSSVAGKKRSSGLVLQNGLPFITKQAKGQLFHKLNPGGQSHTPLSVPAASFKSSGSS